MLSESVSLKEHFKHLSIHFVLFNNAIIFIFLFRILLHTFSSCVIIKRVMVYMNFCDPGVGIKTLDILRKQSR